jgi:hypothetical protein
MDMKAKNKVRFLKFPGGYLDFITDQRDPGYERP